MSRNPVFRGVGTAMITPFSADGRIDTDTFKKLVRRQTDAGVAALIVGGTTGEAPTLSDEERVALIRAAREASGGAIPVLSGCGSADTAHAVKMAREAEAAGADGLLAVTPYYNKTTPRGLVGYYRTVCAATSLPVIAYSVPSRTGMKIDSEIWGELFAIPNLVGLKDAGGDAAASARLISRFGREISVWSGCDDLILPTLSVGGAGVISVISNVVPRRTVALCKLFDDCRNAEAAALAAELCPLCDALFCEVNPIPVKSALAMLGLCGEHYRAPLCPPSEETRRRIASALFGEARPGKPLAGMPLRAVGALAPTVDGQAR